ncbi:MAG: molybdopterin-dependent oxidoreductase, partial [Desulfomicrobium escambiense]|nr:molybdopterin-dependent oxidoreductase [Desulfomicrobium escambiense]
HHGRARPGGSDRDRGERPGAGSGPGGDHPGPLAGRTCGRPLRRRGRVRSRRARYARTALDGRPEDRGPALPLGRTANGRGVHELERAPRPAPARKRMARRASRARGGRLGRPFPGRPLSDPGRSGPGFLVCLDTHWTANAERADVVLPAAAFAEAVGTWVNTEGRVRTYPPAVLPPGRPAPTAPFPPGSAARLGHPTLSARDGAEILGEICRIVPALKGYDPEAARDGSFFLEDDRASGRTPTGAAAWPAVPAGRADVLRGYDPVAANRGYARLRRVR